MASKVAVAIRQEAAIGRIDTAADALASALGLPALDMPRRGKHAELLRAAQLEALASFLEGVHQHMSAGGESKPVSHEDEYRALTKKDLLLLAVERGIDMSRIKTKEEVVRALLLADQSIEGEAMP